MSTRINGDARYDAAIAELHAAREAHPGVPETQLPLVHALPGRRPINRSEHPVELVEVDGQACRKVFMTGRYGRGVSLLLDEDTYQRLLPHDPCRCTLYKGNDGKRWFAYHPTLGALIPWITNAADGDCHSAANGDPTDLRRVNLVFRHSEAQASARWAAKQNTREARRASQGELDALYERSLESYREKLRLWNLLATAARLTKQPIPPRPKKPKRPKRLPPVRPTVAPPSKMLLGFALMREGAADDAVVRVPSV